MLLSMTRFCHPGKECRDPGSREGKRLDPRLIHAGMTCLMFVFAKQAGNDFDLILFVSKEKITKNFIFANGQFFGRPE